MSNAPRFPGRPRKPDAMTAVERARASRANRGIRTVDLDAEAWQDVARIQQPGEAAVAVVKRALRDAAARAG